MALNTTKNNRVKNTPPHCKPLTRGLYSVFKPVIISAIMITFQQKVIAQNGNANSNALGANWKSNGNAATTSDFIGTTNNQSLIFKVYNFERALIDANGDFIIKDPIPITGNLGGGGGRFIISPGTINRTIPTSPIAAYMLKVGGSGFFDGEVNARKLFIEDQITFMKSLKGPRIDVDTIKMDNNKGIYGNTRVFGDVDIKQNLSVAGDATIDGTLRVSSLGNASGGILITNANGDLSIFDGHNDQNPDPVGCTGYLPNTLYPNDLKLDYWQYGGNTLTAYCQGWIGTKNNYEFSLITNGIVRMALREDGEISVINGMKIGDRLSIHNYVFPANSPLKLGVNGPSAFQGKVKITVPNSGDSPLSITNSSSYNLFEFTNGGRLGIGTDNPADALDAKGSGYFRQWDDDTKYTIIGAAGGEGVIDAYKNNTNGTRTGVPLRLNNYSHGDVVIGDNVTPSPLFVSGITYANSGLHSNGASNFYAPYSQTNYIEVGHNGTNSFIEAKGAGNLHINTISNKPVLIGGTNSSGVFMLEVNGAIRTKRIKVETDGWSDFVFENDYKLQDLKTLENYLIINKHLPEIPSESELISNGIDLGEMQNLQMRKLEESYLYIIQLKKELDLIKAELEILKSNEK